jgi:hypothetical protein
MGLLIGAALATFWRPARLRSDLRPGARALITGTGIVALAAVMWFFLAVGEFTPWMYRGGFLLLALIVALLIAMATHPASPLGGWMGSQPWRYIGQRSYGLYLWHWPIFMVTRPGADVPLDGLPLFLVRMALTFGIAELSFRFLEMPIRRGAIDRFVARWRESAGAARQRLTRIAVAVIAGLLAFIIGVGVALAAVPASEQAVAPDVAEAIGIADGGPTEVSIDDPVAEASSAATPGSSAAGEASPAASPQAPAENPNGTLSAIGDSVMLGARNALTDAIPGARVDASVSRFPGAFVGRIKKLRARDKLADIVVLHPVTNGVLPEDMMREMLDLLADYERVVVVNGSVPRPWEGPNNRAVAAAVRDYPNAVLADWNAAAEGNPDYFVSDGIHLTPKGARAYSRLIKQAAGL